MEIKEINTDVITAEELLENFEMTGQRVILNDGQVVGFTDK